MPGRGLGVKTPTCGSRLARHSSRGAAAPASLTSMATLRSDFRNSSARPSCPRRPSKMPSTASGEYAAAFISLCAAVASVLAPEQAAQLLQNSCMQQRVADPQAETMHVACRASSACWSVHLLWLNPTSWGGMHETKQKKRAKHLSGKRKRVAG